MYAEKVLFDLKTKKRQMNKVLTKKKIPSFEALMRSAASQIHAVLVRYTKQSMDL